MTHDDEIVESFLSKLQQLDQKAQDEDFRRSQQLRSDLHSRSPAYSDSRRYQDSDIIIPRPIARAEQPTGMVKSESIMNFNAQISREYRVDLDELEYESAYNYEKSSNHGGVKNYGTSDFEPFTQSETPNSNTERLSDPHYVPKKRDMPDIIRFDDFASKRPYKPVESRYSKFQISNEKKNEIDQTLNELMGKALTLDSSDGDDESPVQPLVRTHKGGEMGINNGASHVKSIPELAPPLEVIPLKKQRSLIPDIEVNDLNGLKKSPRKFDLSSPEKRDINIKKSPAKLDFSKYNSSYGSGKLGIESKTDKASPPTKPKPSIDFKRYSSPTPKPKPKPISFMNSVMDHTLSTKQALPTDTKIKITPLNQTGNSWMDSVRDHSSSTAQSLPSDPKFGIPSSSKNDNTWLESAKRNTPVKTQNALGPTKIRISHNDANTLSKNLSKSEELEQRRASTLKELDTGKLHHVQEEKLKKESSNPSSNFSPKALKKVRPSVPTKPTKLAATSTDPEFLQAKLTTSSRVVERKVSDEPEAFKKSKALKPPVPKRKPSYHVPEALEIKSQLKRKDKVTKKPEEEPEGLIQLKNLKPSKPLRKPSVKELEALENLKKIKARGSNPPAVKPKNERVVSKSKEILESQLNRLKSVKEESSPIKSNNENLASASSRNEHKNNLEQLLLRKTRTIDPNTTSSSQLRHSQYFASSPGPKKAATFDESKSSKQPTLEHINAKRSRGPKRRAPKSIK